ncbi:MAG: chemotaxis protein CheW [Myxococcota bacterium]|jgi:chemotaxis signal transduction protein|nr:chemotaxis protein CheW [Myxococcota bacterium]
MDERDKRLLQQRAARYAIRNPNDSEYSRSAFESMPSYESQARDHSFVIFRLGGERFALQATSVLAVGPMPPLVPLPGQPDAVRGICLFRGVCVSVIDLAGYLGVSLSEESLLMTAHDPHGRPLSFAIEGVDDVCALELSDEAGRERSVDWPVRAIARTARSSSERSEFVSIIELGLLYQSERISVLKNA